MEWDRGSTWEGCWEGRAKKEVLSRLNAEESKRREGSKREGETEEGKARPPFGKHGAFKLVWVISENRVGPRPRPGTSCLRGQGLSLLTVPQAPFVGSPRARAKSRKRASEKWKRTGSDPTGAETLEKRGPITQSQKENERAGARATRSRYPRKIYGAAQVPRTGCTRRCCHRQ